MNQQRQRDRWPDHPRRPPAGCEVAYESLSPAGPGGGPELRVTGGVNLLPVAAMFLALLKH